MATELKPCPHCGKTETLEVVAAVDLLCDEDERDAYMHSDSFGVVCSAAKPDGPGGCGAMGGFMPTREAAAEAWNRRTHPAQAVLVLTDAEIDALYAKSDLEADPGSDYGCGFYSGARWAEQAVRAKMGVAVPYDQTALELCSVCGWKTLIPGDCCLNCARQTKAEQPEPQLKRIHPLNMPLEVFLEDLPTRPRRIIKDEMMYFTHSGDEYIKPPFTVRHLLMFSRSEMRKWPNLGKKSLNEIEECLRNRGLQLWEQHDERSLKFLRQHPTYWIERHGIVGKEGA